LEFTLAEIQLWLDGTAPARDVETCPRCKGSSVEPDEESYVEPCHECHGTGTVKPRDAEREKAKADAAMRVAKALDVADGHFKAETIRQLFTALAEFRAVCAPPAGENL
jgi:DnaJ-class molecular chaperone